MEGGKRQKAAEFGGSLQEAPQEESDVLLISPSTQPSPYLAGDSIPSPPILQLAACAPLAAATAQPEPLPPPSTPDGVSTETPAAAAADAAPAAATAAARGEEWQERQHRRRLRRAIPIFDDEGEDKTSVSNQQHQQQDGVLTLQQEQQQQHAVDASNTAVQNTFVASAGRMLLHQQQAVRLPRATLPRFPRKSSLQQQQQPQQQQPSRFRFTPNVSAASVVRPPLAAAAAAATAVSTHTTQRDFSLAGMLLNATPLGQQQQQQQWRRTPEPLKRKTEEQQRQKVKPEQQQQQMEDRDVLQQEDQPAETLQQQQRQRCRPLESLSSSGEESWFYSPVSLPFSREKAAPATVADALKAAARAAPWGGSSSSSSSAEEKTAAGNTSPFLLLQLPRYLPPVDREAMVQQDLQQQQHQQHQQQRWPGNSSNGLKSPEPLATLEELPTGRLGKLLVRRSGSATLQLHSCSSAAEDSAVAAAPGAGAGGLEFNVSLGCEIRSVQQCGVMLPDIAEFVLLGGCPQRLVVSPMIGTQFLKGHSK